MKGHVSTHSQRTRRNCHSNLKALGTSSLNRPSHTALPLTDLCSRFTITRFEEGTVMLWCETLLPTPVSHGGFLTPNLLPDSQIRPEEKETAQNSLLFRTQRFKIQNGVVFMWSKRDENAFPLAAHMESAPRDCGLEQCLQVSLSPVTQIRMSVVNPHFHPASHTFYSF